MDVYTLIVAGHVIGTILGVGGATVAEFQIAKALSNKQVSPEERALLHVNYKIIRVGMAIVLVSVLAMFWYHLSRGNTWIITSEKLWIKDIMFVAIFINAYALQKRLVPLWLGASISFTSWWGATLLGLAGRSVQWSFLTYFIVYVASIFIMAGILHLVRSRISNGSITS